MRSIKQIRQIFGMSQQQLAIYLSVTRSLLALAECGSRSLPTAALVKLAQLTTSLQSNMPYRVGSFQQQATQDAAHITAYAKKCGQQAAVQKAKLQLLTENYQQCMQAVMALGHLLHHQPTKKEALLLAVLEASLLKKMSRCGYAAQVLLRLRIAGLQQEAALAGKLKF